MSRTDSVFSPAVGPALASTGIGVSPNVAISANANVGAGGAHASA